MTMQLSNQTDSFLVNDEPLVKGLFAKPGETEDVTRRVIRQLSTGSVALQLGNFITEEEINEGIKYLESFSFLDGLDSTK